MNRVTAVVLTFLLLAVPTGAMTDDEVWRLIERTQKEKPFPDADAVILADHVETTFKENGASTTDEEMLVLIRKEAAAGEYRAVRYDFNPRTANITILTVKVFRADGKTIEETPSESFLTVPAPAGGMYWNFVQTLAPVPRLGDGDTLYYKIRRKGLNLAYLDDAHDYIPPQRDHFFDSTFFEAEIPMIRKTYILHAPRSKPVQYKLVNGTVRPMVEFEPGMYRYTWERENVPAFEEEPYGAAYSEAACKLVMATLEDWESKSRWAYEVNEPQFVISDEMRRTVEEIIAGAVDDRDKMFRLLHWVADEVRYLGLDMGEGEGYTVHRTDEIFRDRVGVCKDKAAVLVAMLRAAGFETYFILTLAMEKAVDVPADQFNHGVVGVRDKDGGWIFLDPTWAPNNRPLFNHEEQEQPILIATPEGEDLAAIPYSPPEENPWTVTAVTDLSATGPTRIDIRVEADGYGDGRMRANVNYRLEAQRHTYFAILAEDISPYARILDYGYGDTADYHTPMTMTMTCEVDDYVLPVENRLFFIPPVSKHLFSRRYESDYLYAAEPEKRTHDLTLDCTRSMRFEETIRLPKGYHLEEIPEKIEMDGPAASLTWEVREKRRELLITQRVDIKKRWITPEEYVQFKEVVDKVNELRKKELVLVKEASK
ncbi:DUF3857 domain-containing protein [bacterium]|nr:DUF3857 domain-containing protein [candidate division CSSED10-310 bacterium]